MILKVPSWLSSLVGTQIVLAGLSGAAAQDPGADARIAGAFEVFGEFEARYSDWKGTRGSNTFDPAPGRGNQIYSPWTIGVDYEKESAVRLESRLKGGFVSSHHRTPGQEAVYDGPVDTQASFNATFLNFETFRPALGVTVNLPTGEAYLPNNKRFSRMDSDLVEVGSYGAGFNVNPTAGVTFAVTDSIIASVSAGYTWRGAYDKETLDFVTGLFDAKQRIDPGEVFTANSTVAASFGRLSLLGGFSFMAETDLKLDGIPFARKGYRYVTNLVAVYEIDEQTALSLSGFWSYQEKDKISDGFGGLLSELKNNNNQVFIFSAEPSYQFSEKLKLTGVYSLLYRPENTYDIVEQQFIPAKVKHSAGGALTYTVDPKTTIEFRGSYFWIVENTGSLTATDFYEVVPALGAPFIFIAALENLPPKLHYRGFTAAVTAKIRF
jgi:hypothetical protein